MTTHFMAEHPVLLVDDDEDILRDYGKIIERTGPTVFRARDGREALRILAEKEIHAVFTDLYMPNMGGLEFLRAVRSVDLEVPVVLMTAEPGLESAIAAVEHGALQYLIKPVEPDQLRTALTRAIQFQALARLQGEAAAASEVPPPRLPDRASMEVRFRSALDQLWIAFQPIVRWSERTVFAYEALVRSDEPTLGRPDELFDVAERLGRTAELGREIRRLIAAHATAKKDAFFFVNVNPSDLCDNDLYSHSSPLGQVADRVALEITERSDLGEVSGLTTRIQRLRHVGFRLAIDDLGAGYAGLSSFVRLEPDFVKLDMSLIRGIHRSPRKKSLVQGISKICARDLGIQVICEGVEQDEERRVLTDAGLDLLQGYHFAKPGRPFPTPEFVRSFEGHP